MTSSICNVEQQPVPQVVVVADGVIFQAATIRFEMLSTAMHRMSRDYLPSTDPRYKIVAFQLEFVLLITSLFLNIKRPKLRVPHHETLTLNCFCDCSKQKKSRLHNTSAILFNQDRDLLSNEVQATNSFRRIKINFLTLKTFLFLFEILLISRCIALFVTIFFHREDTLYKLN